MLLLLLLLLSLNNYKQLLFALSRMKKRRREKEAEVEKREKVLATIQYRWNTDGPFALEIWTDGSVVDRVGVGAARVYAQGEVLAGEYPATGKQGAHPH
jgi:hypothetical protein